ncbi:sensor histidine kinase [Paenibacillus sp. 1P07SE]|uniref:sensor histidine kinase n=1 Tax=Paenibacillus sp. 1P07SE TaxID=3132209 RepID=UPI0039A6B41C
MTHFQNNVFSKVVAIIMMLLIPVVLMYTYSNRVSVNVLQEKIEEAQFSKFDFFLNQLTAKIDELAQSGFILSNDQSIRELAYLSNYESEYSRVESKKSIMNKLVMQAATLDWIDHLSVYAPSEGHAVSFRPGLTGMPTLAEGPLEPGWQYEQREGLPNRFVRYTVYPITGYANVDRANVVVETGFNEGTLISYLDNYKRSGEGDPFLYHPEHGIIANRTADMERVSGIAGYIQDHRATYSSRSSIFHLDEDLVMTMRSDWMGWVVVDYLSLEQLLLPIKQTNRNFYLSTTLLLVLGLVASYLLYLHIRLPLKELVSSLQRLKRGDFSVHIQMKPRNEFGFVMERFNDMVAQIRQLIQKVYVEELRAKEAELKQLQSQINPHFLYNCLHFIRNMTILGDDKAVISMAVSLGTYYRYVTRVDNPIAPLREEMELVRNYLHIQSMRMSRIRFQIDVPEEMLDTEVPRLIVQPIVENALIHGLEKQKKEGVLRVKGEVGPERFRLLVEDNGGGMDDERLRQFEASLNRPLREDMGYGVWNVHQRLVNLFGEGAGLQIAKADGGGLRVTLEWSRRQADV